LLFSSSLVLLSFASGIPEVQSASNEL
jgi:hypothetical protein